MNRLTMSRDELLAVMSPSMMTNTKDAKGHGSVKKQCGFTLVPGVKSVRKHPEHEFNGTKIVTLDNGDEHHIYFDRQSGMYMHEKPVEERLSRGAGNLASIKEEALPNLVARQAEFKPENRTRNVAKPFPPGDDDDGTDADDGDATQAEDGEAGDDQQDDDAEGQEDEDEDDGEADDDDDADGEETALTPQQVEQEGKRLLADMHAGFSQLLAADVHDLSGTDGEDEDEDDEADGQADDQEADEDETGEMDGGREGSPDDGDDETAAAGQQRLSQPLPPVKSKPFGNK